MTPCESCAPAFADLRERYQEIWNEWMSCSERERGGWHTERELLKETERLRHYFRRIVDEGSICQADCEHLALTALNPEQPPASQKEAPPAETGGGYDTFVAEWEPTRHAPQKPAGTSPAAEATMPAGRSPTGEARPPGREVAGTSTPQPPCKEPHASVGPAESREQPPAVGNSGGAYAGASPRPWHCDEDTHGGSWSVWGRGGSEVVAECAEHADAALICEAVNWDALRCQHRKQGQRCWSKATHTEQHESEDYSWFDEESEPLPKSNKLIHLCDDSAPPTAPAAAPSETGALGELASLYVEYRQHWFARPYELSVDVDGKELGMAMDRFRDAWRRAKDALAARERETERYREALERIGDWSCDVYPYAPCWEARPRNTDWCQACTANAALYGLSHTEESGE